MASDLTVGGEFKLTYNRDGAGSLRLDDFGGACLHDKILYVTDMANNCVERVPLP